MYSDGVLVVHSLIHEGERSSIFFASLEGHAGSCAVKCFHLAEEATNEGNHGSREREVLVERIRRENEMLQAVGDHPFIVKYQFAHLDPERAYIGMECVVGMDLFTHLSTNGPLEEPAAQLLAAEVALALSHLHSLDIVHADLKAESVIIDAEGHVKLVDFGSAVRLHGGEQLTSVYGTPENMAPEMILGYGYDRMIDMWALGCLLWDALTTSTPFLRPEQSVPELLGEIVRGFLDFDSFPELNNDMQQVLARFLDPEPSRRLGASSDPMSEILSDPWFAHLDQEALAAREVPAEIHLNLPAGAGTLAGAGAGSGASSEPVVQTHEAPSDQLTATFDDSWTKCSSFKVTVSGHDEETRDRVAHMLTGGSFGKRTGRRAVEHGGAAQRLAVSMPANFKVSKSRSRHTRDDALLKAQLKKTAEKLRMDKLTMTLP